MKKDKAKALRRQNFINQEDVAKVLNVSVNAYRAKENGQTRFYFDEIEKLAWLYGVSITEFADQPYSGNPYETTLALLKNKEATNHE